MISATIPFDDRSRLFALYGTGVLDGRQDRSFDQIAALAKHVYHADRALITFIDEKVQWLKSNDDLGICQTPRDVAFCSHTILQEGVFIVDDARQDLRFRDNPLVTGHPRIVSYLGIPVHAPTGHRIGALCLLDAEPGKFSGANLTLLESLAKVLEQLIVTTQSLFGDLYIDKLTGLPSEFVLRDQVNMAIAHAGVSECVPSLVEIDIDNFRFLNESLGPASGDRLIAQVANRLKLLTPADAVLCRGNADNFYLLMHNSSSEQVSLLTDNILKQTACLYSIDGQAINLTVSAGIVYGLQQSGSVSSILSACANALKEAQNRGRNLSSYSERYDWRVVKEEASLYRDLKEALSRKELELFYQVELDSDQGEIIGIEALLRWNHPTLGILYPAEFIDLAESTGLIVPIGDFVLRQACLTAQTWRGSGLTNFVVAVNVSIVQLKRGDIVDRVRKVLDSSGLPAEFLELELSESILVDENETLQVTINSLKTLGVRLAIDDFGTGRANLCSVSGLSVDKIKIDQSFIRSMSRRPEDLTIVRAIRQLADSLGIELVAEGVETEAELTLLREQNIRKLQGYIFGRPVRAYLMEKMIAVYLLSRGPSGGGRLSYNEHWYEGRALQLLSR